MKRNPIRDGSLLRLKLQEPQTDLYRTFRIERMLPNGDGSTFLCYEASHPQSAVGVLREFFPSASGWSRDSAQYLRSDGDKDEDGLPEERQVILDTYDRLLAVKKTHPDLAACLPYWEIYLPPAGSSFYLFTVEPKCVTFEELCIPKEGEDIEAHLQKILSCLIALCQCVSLLHEAGVLHCDIKPDNFGCLKRKEQVLTENVTFFDLNSFIPDDWQPRYVTPQFFDPLTALNGVSKQIDLYSIGCCINWAMRTVLLKTTDPDSSAAEPLSVDEMTAVWPDCPEFARAIRTILHRTLSFPRYDDCQALEEDLRQAASLLLRQTLDRHAKESLCTETLRQQLRLHFHVHPLCSNAAGTDAPYRVLILGDGPFSGLLLDHVLVYGQTDCPLEVDVIGMEDPIGWLDDRPALSQFFAISDGALASSYGRISFSSLPLSSQHFGGCAHGLNAWLEDHPSGFGAIYISLKDSSRTRAILRLLHASVQTDRIWTDRAIARTTFDPLLHQELEQMGFRIHCLWERWRGLSRDELEKRYTQPDFHQASLNHAAAVSSQLHLLGLDTMLIQEGSAKTAEAFVRLHKEWPVEQWEAFRMQAAWMAHRRWAVEKLVRGYRPADLSAASLGNTVSETEKTHIRLIRVDAKEGDDREDDPLACLDELAEQFHQRQKESAQFLLDTKLLTLDRLSALETILEGRDDLRNAFSAWEMCVRQTMEMDEDAWKDYFVLSQTLRQNASRLGGPLWQIVQVELDGFDAMFKPFIQAAARRDWKAEYLRFVDRIPWILYGNDPDDES